MTDKQDYTAAAATAAAIASAIALLKSNKVAAAGEFSLDEVTKQLLASMAQATGDIDLIVAQILAGMGGLQSIGGQLAVPNATFVRFVRMYPPSIALPAVANNLYQFDDIVVPDTMELVIKGWPGNAGAVYVGDSPGSVKNPAISAVYPLLPNETLSLKITNANTLWASVATVGDSLVYGSEQR